MKILSVEAKSIGGLRDRAFDLRDRDGAPRPVVLVTGPAASGKTAFLRAIAAGKEAVSPYGTVGWLRDVVDAGVARATVSIDWWLEDDEARWGGLRSTEARSDAVISRDALPEGEADPGLLGLLARYDHDPEHGHVDWIPSTRLPLASAGALGDPVEEQRLLRLAPGSEKLAGVVRFIRKAITGASSPQVERARELFARMCPRRELAGITGDGELEVRVEGGARVPARLLASSEQHALVLACHLGVTRPERCVMMLDRPEADLPPGVAARWLDAFREVAPHNQWIVATSDAELLSTHRDAVVEVGR